MSDGAAMREQSIVMGRRVSPSKLELAKDLRRRMTVEERLLWQRIRANRLHGLHFRRQQVIDGFVVDFYCHSARLAVEVDGEAHSRRAEYDSERDRVLSAEGLRILRVSNEDIRRDVDEVLARIGECAERLSRT